MTMKIILGKGKLVGESGKLDKEGYLPWVTVEMVRGNVTGRIVGQ